MPPDDPAVKTTITKKSATKIFIERFWDRTVTATYIIDHDFNNVVLEDDTGGKISTEESIIQNGLIQFDRPFDYKGQPYENNYGFLYYNHKIDQRVSV